MSDQRVPPPVFALALALGCAPSPKSGTTAGREVAKEQGDRQGGGSQVSGEGAGEGTKKRGGELAETTREPGDCDEQPDVESPPWAAKADSPRPSRADFSGSWLPAYDPNSYPPGLVKWQRSCFGGHSMLILQQDGQEVRATWSSSDGVSGMQPEYRYYRAERAVGTRDGDRVVLEGVRTERKVSSMGGGEDEVTCSALRYELTFDRMTKRLVGTMNGDPIQFAPAIINDKPRQDCGAPPP